MIDTVKDLMLWVKYHEDYYDKFESSFLINSINRYDFPKTLDDQLKWIEADKKYLKAAFEVIDDTEPKYSEDIVFVFPYKEDDFENLYDIKDSFDSVLIHAKTLQQIDPETFTVSNIGDGENNVAGYGYEFCAFDEILGFKLSRASLRACGFIETAMAVFNELTFNGIKEEDRNKRIQSLDDSIKEYEEISKLPPEEQNNYYASEEDVFDALHKHIHEDMNDDEEYYQEKRLELDDIFNNDEKIIDIKHKKWKELNNINDANKKKIIQEYIKEMKINYDRK